MLFGGLCALLALMGGVHGTRRPLAWCDSVPCFLLMSTPKTYDMVPPNEAMSDPFIYVPGEALADWLGDALVDWYARPLRTALRPPYHIRTARTPRWGPTYAYEGRAGRLLDLFVDGTGRLGALGMLREVRRKGPFTVRGGRVNGNFHKRCLDADGRFGRRYYHYTNCMSISTVKQQGFRGYSGPVTWNRVTFEADDYLLRFMTTNGRVALPDRDTSMFTQRDFTACPLTDLDHTEGQHDYGPDDPGYCMTVLGVFQYTRLCCCPQQQCPYEAAKYKGVIGEAGTGSLLNDTRWCPVGLLRSDQPLDIVRIPLAAYTKVVVGHYCMTLFNVTTTELASGESRTVFSMNMSAGSNDWLDRIMEEADVGPVFCVANRPRCPSRPHHFLWNVSFTCHCHEPKCANSMVDMYNKWNHFFGIIRSAEFNYTCENAVIGRYGFNPRTCIYYYDPQLRRLVNMQDGSTFLTMHEMITTDFGGVQATPLVVVVSPLVPRSCAAHHAPQYYNASGGRRLLIELECPGRCDSASALEEWGSQAVPLCFFLPDELHLRSIDHPMTKAEVRQMLRDTSLLKSTKTGHCLVQVLSPRRNDNIFSVAFVLRNIRPDEYAPGGCGKVTEEAPCYLRDSFQACCRGLTPNEVNSTYVDYMASLMVFMLNSDVPSDAGNVTQLVLWPGTCPTRYNLNVTQTCGFFPGCVRRFSNEHGRSAQFHGSCLSAHADRSQEARTGRGEPPPPPDVLCMRRDSNELGSLLYADQCVLTQHDYLYDSYVSRLRRRHGLSARALTCCCTRRHGPAVGEPEERVECAPVQQQHDQQEHHTAIYYELFLEDNWLDPTKRAKLDGLVNLLDT